MDLDLFEVYDADGVGATGDVRSARYTDGSDGSDGSDGMNGSDGSGPSTTEETKRHVCLLTMGSPTSGPQAPGDPHLGDAASGEEKSTISLSLAPQHPPGKIQDVEILDWVVGWSTGVGNAGVKNVTQERRAIVYAVTEDTWYRLNTPSDMYAEVYDRGRSDGDRAGWRWPVGGQSWVGRCRMSPRW